MTRGRRTLSEIENAKYQYGMWLGLPINARKEAGLPDCAAEFGRQNGICEETISRWNNDPLVKKVKENAVKMFFGGEMTTWVFMKNLKEEACSKEGKPADKRLFAEITGLVGKKEDTKPEKIEFVVTRATKDR